jgi:sugar phosphate isomerase/epimerase
MREWKLAFHTRSYFFHHNMPLVDSIAAAQKVGFDAVEISMPHLKSLKIQEMKASDRKALRQKIADLGMAIVAISGHSTVCHEDPRIRAEEGAFFKAGLDFAADLGCDIVNTHAMYRRVGEPAGFSRMEPGESLRQFMHRTREGVPTDRRGFLVDVLGDLAQHAATRGVIVGLEDLDPSPAQFWENIIREIGSPGLKQNLQALRGVTPGQAVRQRGDIICHFHMIPPREGAGFAGWSRGEYIDFINALEEVRYSRDYFTVEEHSELDPNETAPQILQYFRTLLG